MAAFGGLMCIFLADRKRAVWLVIFLIPVLWIGSSFASLERASELDDFTVQTRLTAFYVATRAFVDNPIIGIGTTNFPDALNKYVNWRFSTEIAAAHNTYLNVLCEDGVIGFVLFFGPLSWLMLQAWKKRSSPVVLAGIAGMAAFLAHGFVDHLQGDPQYRYTFALMLACCLTALRMGNRSHSLKPN